MPSWAGNHTQFDAVVLVIEYLTSKFLSFLILSGLVLAG